MRVPCCDKYTVIFASNEGGVLPLTVAVWSLLTAARCNTSYRVCILSDGISDESKAYVRKIACTGQPNHTLEFIELDSLLDFNAVNVNICGSWPKSAWARIFIPNLLKDVKRVLYLDIDILVCDDCRSLFEMDMKGAALGAVYERVSVTANAKLGIPKDYAGYFNSGVLLMDLDVFRRKKLAEKLLEYAQEHKEIICYPDQDSLNGVLYDSVVRLHPRWNWNDIGSRKLLNRNPDSKKLIRAATFREAVEASYFPGIIHYCGQYKPWMYNYHITRYLYERAIRESGVKGFNLKERWSLRIFLLRLLYAPLSCLVRWKVHRMIKKYGITNSSGLV